ncbi:hypothetical protein NC651_031068 [Populus alba x Populus x berolinensis]|nr:hypothetical protein NC651_031068 [Populus alba x Populus x berolinensis]
MMLLMMIFVIQPTGKWELLSMVKKPANGSLTWKIEDFSKLDKSSYLSKAFTAEAEVGEYKFIPKEMLKQREIHYLYSWN